MADEEDSEEWKEKFPNFTGSSEGKVFYDSRKRDNTREAISNANAYQISRWCSPPFEPDQSDSDAANFFKSCRDRALERWDEVKREEEDERYDSLHEVADSAVPHQTYKRWIIFVELGGYQDPDPDGLGDFNNITADDFSEVPAMFLYAMAYRIASHVYSEME